MMRYFLRACLCFLVLFVTQRTPVTSGDDKLDVKNPAGAASTDQTDLVAYHGRVVDEDGKGIAGAELWYALPTSLSAPLGDIVGSGWIRKVATTDSDGRFVFSVAPLNWKGPRFAVEGMRLTATASGYGRDYLPLAAFESNPVASERRADLQSRTDKTRGEGRFASRTLKLPPEAGTIRGRLVDLEGQPLAGVEVCLELVENVDMDSLKKAFETSSPELAQQARHNFTSPGWLSSDDWQVLYPRPKTDQNGEFTMRGLGRNQIATVVLHHERVDAEKLYIVGADMPLQKLAISSRRGDSYKETYCGIKFSHAVGPAIPVSGVVTELETGKPVANAQVYVERLFSGGGQNSGVQLRFTRHIRAFTDDQGRYRLIGIPPGNRHVLQVTPNTTEPLFPYQQEFSLEPTQTSATVDLKVLRGIWIEGKVTDAQTGDPIPGRVDYFPFRENPKLSNLSGRLGSIDIGRFAIDESGHYRVAGLPGPGVVMVGALSTKGYPRAAGADKINGYDAKRGRLPSLMNGLPLSNWNQISYVEPPVDANSYHLDITLSAGLTLTGRVVGADGSPVEEVEVLGQVPREERFRKLKDDKFTVTDYTADTSRDLFFTAMKGSLVGYLHLEGQPPAELTVQLQPAVIVRGRLIDTETDELAAGFHLLCESSTRGKFRVDRVETDQDGRFELKGLLAGNIYKMNASNRESFISRKNGFTIDLTNAKPGEVLELSDVTGKAAKKE